MFVAKIIYMYKTTLFTDSEIQCCIIQEYGIKRCPSNLVRRSYPGVMVRGAHTFKAVDLRRTLGFVDATEHFVFFI